MTSASSIFAFIESHPPLAIERFEFEMTEFRSVRRNLGAMAMLLRQSQDEAALDLAATVRRVLSEWLTVPVSFKTFIAEQLQSAVGPPKHIRARWGAEIGDLYADAIDGAVDLAGETNPLRQRLKEEIAEAVSGGEIVRIFCHSSAASHFQSFTPPNAFIHSPAWYRRCEPFDTLFKVGPLRSRGWGSVPDALISAPRYSRLALFVWEGCADEEGFGSDPVTTLAATGIGGIRSTRVVPAPRAVRIGVDLSGVSDDAPLMDELQFFSTFEPKADARNATLVQMDSEYGILFPPYSHVLSFDPAGDAHEPLSARLVDEDLREGMFLIRHIGHDVNGPEVHAEHGEFSRIWKAKLNEEFRHDRLALCDRLRKAGIELEHLETAVRHWCRPPTTVIHAPQKRSHFETLIRQLKIETAVPRWWQRAWKEIAASRGVAIVAGVEEREHMDHLLLASLGELLPEIRQMAGTANRHFVLSLHQDCRIGGTALFDRVELIETGFKAPDSELREVRELGGLGQWRA